ncbi:MAG TPA: LysE family translocator [Gaiellaceae bacterium]|nr:LysE family translocator [Gaiellaceae bacterium]HUI36411.1 LysE family translocator [Gaiellaceae bacterium]
MSAAQLAAFLGVSAVVIVTPGQDTALTIRNTLLGGRSGGIATAAGVVSGQLVWAFAASAGLSAVLLASAPLFMAIRIAGAAYLVLLGVQALVAAIRGAHRVNADAAPRRRRAPYRQGVLSNLGNPKMAVFFTSLLPQFGSSFAAMLALGLVFATLTLVWLSAYAVAVAKATNFLQRSWVRRALDAVTGLVLVALGLRVATER